LFLAVFAVFYLSPNRTSFDSRWSVHTALSLLRGDGGGLEEFAPVLQEFNNTSVEFPDGRPRTVYPVGASLLALPFAAATQAINPGFASYAKTVIPEDLEALAASFYGALAVVLMFLVSRRLGLASGPAFFVSLLFAFGTSMWSTATRALWQHGPLMLMHAGVLWLLLKAKEKPSAAPLAALPLAFAYIVRPTAALAAAAVSVYMLAAHRKFFGRYLLCGLIPLIPWCAFNLHVYGHPLPTYYRMSVFGELSPTLFEAMAGHWVSPSRGLLVYSPALLFSLWGIVMAVREREDRFLHLCLAGVVLAHWAAVSNAPWWWGGDSYGPRLMSDVTPFLIYFLAYAWVKRPLWAAPIGRRAVFLAAALWSVAVNGVGAVSWAAYEWNGLPRSIEEDHGRLWSWRDPAFLRRPSLRMHRYRASRFYLTEW